MDHNLLVAARSEYTEKLQDILCDDIYQNIKEIWETCKLTSKTTPLGCFQKKLCLIPEWNQEVINNILKRITKNNDISVEYLDKIIEAVFLSNVKILSVVKLNDSKQTIDVRVPDTKNFIHRCYIESARRFYADPYLIDDRESGSNTKHEINRNIKRCNSTVRDSIDKTIRGMIPMEDILTKYLAEVDNYASDTSKENEPHAIEEKQEEPWNEPEPPKEEQTIPEFTQYDPQPNLFQQDDDPFDKKPEVSPQEMDDPFISPQNNEFENNEPEKLRVNLNQEKIKVDLPMPEKNFFSDSD